ENPVTTRPRTYRVGNHKLRGRRCTIRCHKVWRILRHIGQRAAVSAPGRTQQILRVGKEIGGRHARYGAGSDRNSVARESDRSWTPRSCSARIYQGGERRTSAVSNWVCAREDLGDGWCLVYRERCRSGGGSVVVAPGVGSQDGVGPSGLPIHSTISSAPATKRNRTPRGTVVRHRSVARCAAADIDRAVCEAGGPVGDPGGQTRDSHGGRNHGG